MNINYKNTEYKVELLNDSDTFFPVINDEKLDITARLIDDNTVILHSDGKKYTVYAVADENHLYVNINGKNIILAKPKDEDYSFDSGDSKSGDIDIIKPPMPGSIVKVIAETGQKVTEGEALIIVEAMKMETTIYSSIDGIVKEINVTAGEQVNTDKVMMIVEKETVITE